MLSPFKTIPHEIYACISGCRHRCPISFLAREKFPRALAEVCALRVLSSFIFISFFLFSFIFTFATDILNKLARSAPCCTKCNSPPISGQCTNFISFDVAL